MLKSIFSTKNVWVTLEILTNFKRKCSKNRKLSNILMRKTFLPKTIILQLIPIMFETLKLLLYKRWTTWISDFYMPQIYGMKYLPLYEAYSSFRFEKFLLIPNRCIGKEISSPSTQRRPSFLSPTLFLGRGEGETDTVSSSDCPQVSSTP